MVPVNPRSVRLITLVARLLCDSGGQHSRHRMAKSCNAQVNQIRSIAGSAIHQQDEILLNRTSLSPWFRPRIEVGLTVIER
jgi:hypothetical protein